MTPLKNAKYVVNELKMPESKKLIDAFLASRKLPDPMTTEFANAVQEALSGLEKIAVKGDEIKQALLQGGSPATPDDLRKRFDQGGFIDHRASRHVHEVAVRTERVEHLRIDREAIEVIRNGEVWRTTFEYAASNERHQALMERLQAINGIKSVVEL